MAVYNKGIFGMNKEKKNIKQDMSGFFLQF
jgi:hypothetical protein